jgi:hypothetical protein
MIGFRKILYLLIIIACFCLPDKLFSQSPTNLDNKVLLTKEYNVFAMAHTEGWGIGGRFGRNQTFYKQRMMEFELLNMKHPKEIKSINPYFIGNKSYIFGKLNYLYFLRIGLGTQKTLNEKPYWGGVKVQFFYSYGLTNAFTVPVYLYVLNYTANPGEYIVSEEKFDADKHDQSNIYGRASWFSGLGETKFHPGLYFKSGCNFEFGDNDNSIKALEAGFVVDGFLKEIPMMAFDNNKQLFLSFYLSFHLGKRYN